LSGSNISHALPPAGHVVFHDRDAASEPMLVPQPLEDPLGRMVLLHRPGFVIGQNAVDDRDERIELRPHRRPAAPVARRHREPRSRIDPEAPRRRPLAQSLNPHRPPDLRIKIHPLHPTQAQGFQLPDFYSGATDRFGRFTEGFSLRRLHVPWLVFAIPRNDGSALKRDPSGNGHERPKMA
jgi:hypothetical protein